MNLQRAVLIFSAWRAHVTDEKVNHASVNYVKRALDKRGIKWQAAQGVYKGNSEPAIVVIDTASTRATVQGLARLFEQESILLVDCNGAARLETCDGTLIRGLGKLRNVPENVARALDAWTRVGNQFYTTESL
jgi:hypothetical protein